MVALGILMIIVGWLGNRKLSEYEIPDTNTRLFKMQLSIWISCYLLILFGGVVIGIGLV